MLRFPKPEVLSDVPPHGDVVIEASAGTGKTYTLERLIIDLMLGDGTQDGFVSVEAILVVTFTERATRELRSRVRGLLEEIVTTTQDCAADVPHWEISEDARTWLERQLFSFDRAPIHTIHGWCHRVLTENAFFIGKLLDQEHADAQRLFDLAFVTALRNHFANDEALSPFLEAWLEDSTIDALRRDLSELIRTDAVVRPNFEGPRLVRLCREVSELNPQDVLRAYHAANPAPTVMRFEAADKVERLLMLASEVRSVADLPNVLGKMPEWFTDWCQDEARKPYMVGEPLGLIRELLWFVVPLRPAILQQFLPTMRDALETQKARGLFDYDDMLRAVWQKLDDPSANGGELLKHLQNRYRYALIDEFQDTDAVQWSIFKKIFHDSKWHRLFVIGDPKQAIYAFRGADVNTYLEARKTISANDQPHVVLKENFRSTQHLITAYNTVFDQSVPEPVFTGSIGYDEPVVCGRPDAFEAEFESGTPNAPMVLVRMVPDGNRIFASDLKRRHGEFIAREIRRICDEDPLWVDGADGKRRIRPKDIFVLTHTGVEERLVGEHLKAAGVPFAFYKQEGLFQTPEALDVLDLLVAIEDPYLVSNRLKVWSTAFFAVEFDQLQACADLPETHPLFERLVTWHETAMSGRFDQLFSDIVEHSGLIRREIFLKTNERELTNYQHIFEVLTEEVHARGLDMRELILRLRAFHDESRLSDRDERNVQRLETEKDAVQVMTMHKSKGLEAAVVFVYGGWTRRPVDRFSACHFNGTRILYIGMPHLEQVQELVRNAADEEAQRLLYVAATRAKAKLYMPLIGTVDGELEFRNLAGVYRAINPRLLQIAVHEPHPFIRVEHVRSHDPDQQSAERSKAEPLKLDLSPIQLFPPVSQLEHVRPPTRIVTSYSRMKAASGGYKGPSDADEDTLAIELAIDTPTVEEARLPGGTDTGLFLHDIMEHIDFADGALGFDDWCEASDSLLGQMMERHGVDLRWRDEVERMVYAVVSNPVPLPDGSAMTRLADMSRGLPEMEFLFPIPEAAHPDLAATGGEVGIERGFIKGYIDLLFEHEGLIYFADWKSDTLDAYGAESLNPHVEANYATQAMLYTLATISHFGIATRQDYDARFGGYLYFFLRGGEASNHGVFAARPTYDEVVAYRAELIATEFV